jgi:hypothetical protein
MTAFNVVRFRVKPGREEQFIDAHRRAKMGFPGFRHGALLNTGDRSYCFIGEWDGIDDIHAAEPAMVAILDQFRETLEVLAGDLGVTDPVSGEVIVRLTPGSPGDWTP